MILLLLIFSAVCGIVTSICFFSYVSYHIYEHKNLKDRLENSLKDKFLEYECAFFGDKNGNPYRKKMKRLKDKKNDF